MTETDRERYFKAMAEAPDFGAFSRLLRGFILLRLDLPEETAESRLYYLVLYSVRIKMPDEDVNTLESRLSTVDCHQTSFIVSKKTLLMLEIERGLSVGITPDDAEDVSKYAEVLWRAMRHDA